MAYLNTTTHLKAIKFPAVQNISSNSYKKRENDKNNHIKQLQQETFCGDTM